MSNENQDLKKLSLFDITPNRWENYRTSISESKLNELADNLKFRQITPVCVTKPDDSTDGKYGLVAGFCRYEGMCRNALRELVNRYNEELKLMPDDPRFVYLGGREDNGFLSSSEHHPSLHPRQVREFIRNTSTKWAAEYDNALKAYSIDAKVVDCENDHEALMINWDENEYRTQPTLRDKIRRVVELSQKGVPAKVMAAKMNLSQSAVSQYKTVYAFPENTRKFFEDIKDATFQARLETALQEWERRMSINDRGEDRMLAMSFAVARDLSFIMKDLAQNPRPFPNKPQVLLVIQLALAITEAGITNPGRRLPEITIMRPRLEEIKLMAKASDRVAEPTPAAPVEASKPAATTKDALARQAATRSEVPVFDDSDEYTGSADTEIESIGEPIKVPAVPAPAVAAKKGVTDFPGESQADDSAGDVHGDLADSLSVGVESLVDDIGDEEVRDVSNEIDRKKDLQDRIETGQQRTGVVTNVDAKRVEVTLTAETLEQRAGKALSLAKKAMEIAGSEPMELVIATSQFTVAEALLGLAKSPHLDAVSKKSSACYESTESVIAIFWGVFQRAATHQEKERFIASLPKA